MPQTDDRSLVEHLATKVMVFPPDDPVCYCGETYSRHSIYENHPFTVMEDPHPWNPLDSWADAGMVWDTARARGIWLRLSGVRDGWVAVNIETGDGQLRDSGPRAICEAVAKATGWEPEGGSDAR